MFQPSNLLVSVTANGAPVGLPLSGSTLNTVDMLETSVFSAVTMKPNRKVCALFTSYDASNCVPYIWLARVTSEATPLKMRSLVTSGMK